MKTERLGTREYLRQIEKINVQIEEMDIRVKELKEIATAGGAMRYDKPDVMTALRTDTKENQILDYVVLEQEVEARRLELENLKNKITFEIQQVDDARYMQVLFKRYVECKDMLIVASEMNYSYEWTRHLLTQAVTEFEKFRRN